MKKKNSFDVFFEDFYRNAILSETGKPLSLRSWLDHAEAWRINQALKNHGGNRSAAARTLGIGRRTLYSKMERLGIGHHSGDGI